MNRNNSWDLVWMHHHVNKPIVTKTRSCWGGETSVLQSISNDDAYFVFVWRIQLLNPNWVFFCRVLKGDTFYTEDTLYEWPSLWVHLTHHKPPYSTRTIKLKDYGTWLIMAHGCLWLNIIPPHSPVVHAWALHGCHSNTLRSFFNIVVWITYYLLAKKHHCLVILRGAEQ